MTAAPAELARSRLAELLSAEAAARASEADAWRDGYLDLAPEGVESTGTTQSLMLTRAVPAIYERWWRPALGRAFKGLGGPGMAEELRIARLFLGLSGGERVLDLACGPGNFSRRFARITGQDGFVVGLDASPTMLAKGVAEARAEGLANIVFVRGDATALPLRDGSVDCVCCFAALHLFAEPFGALDEMRRVLGPGGRIALMTSIRRAVAPWPVSRLAQGVSGMRVFEPDEITDALADRGFVEVGKRFSGFVQFVGGRLPE